MLKTNATPKYRRQRRPRSRDVGFVVLDDRRHYLPEAYGSLQSTAAYHRLLAEWTAKACVQGSAGDEISVVEVCARYWKHADVYYRRPDGKPTMVHRVKMAMKPVKALYGRTLAKDFGPNELRAVRQVWIAQGLSRTTVNHYVNAVRKMFKWAVGHELVPPYVHHGLQAVEGLRRGRSGARETEPVQPVPEDHVEAIKPYVSRQVWALVRLQLLTGARPGELITMRPIDVAMTRQVWTYSPTTHKTQHHGHKRIILIGPRGQEILRLFLPGRPVVSVLFDPREAIREKAGRFPTHRRPGQPKQPPKTNRAVGDRYTVDSYRRAIHRACKEADVPQWSPHRLRHNAATNLRREHGIDVAQTILGHRLGSTITKLYAEANTERARDVISKIG